MDDRLQSRTVREVNSAVVKTPFARPRSSRGAAARCRRPAVLDDALQEQLPLNLQTSAQLGIVTSLQQYEQRTNPLSDTFFK